MTDRPAKGPRPAAVRRLPLGVLLGACLVVVLAAAGILSSVAGLPWLSGAGTARTGGAAGCAGVAVRPGDDLQQAADTHPAGTTFCLTAGIHRLAQVVPKDGQRFIGEGERTVLSGARVLRAADARRAGPGRWYWDGQTQQSDPWGTLVGPGHGQVPNEGDRYAEELFETPSGEASDPPVRLRRMVDPAQLGPGRWFLDQRAHRLYVADDPATMGLIEASATRMAIGANIPATVRGVTIENLVVEKYASPTQLAAVGGRGAIDWNLSWVTVRYNHGIGVELGPGTVLAHCSIHHMGQEGLSGGGDARQRPTTVRSTEVAFNRTLTYDPDWDAGGAKFTRAYGRGLVVENSWFHHNEGYGLWLDIDNYDVTIRSNRIEANDRAGIFHEVSRRARIYWNEVTDNSDGPDNQEFGGAGILLSNSAQADVHNNVVRDNDNGIFVFEDEKVTRWRADSYRQGLPHIVGLRVHDNDVAMSRGITGMWVENGDPKAYWRPSNVRFEKNTYRLSGAKGRFLGPGNQIMSFAEWQDLGHDRNGRSLPAAGLGSLPAGATAFVMGDYGAQGGIQ